MRKLGGLALAICLSWSPVARAEAINVDFGDTYTGISSAFGAASGQVGNWNDIVVLGTTPALLDTQGGSTEVSVTVAANTPAGAQASSGTTDTAYLLEDNFYSSPGSGWSVTFSNLDDGIYHIFVYAPANTLVSTRPFEVNGVLVADIPGSLTSTFVQGTTYEVATDVNVSGGTLAFVPIGTNGYGGLAGVQIVPIPEPSTALLLGFGLVALAAGRRRC